MTGEMQHDATTEFNEALAAGFAADNFDAIGPFYTEDASVMPPRGRVLQGRDALPAFWSGLSKRFKGVSYTTTSLRNLGDAVRRETGTYAMTGGEQPFEGRYLFVWLLVDSEWQIESAIWNRGGEAGGRRQGQGQGQGGRAGAGGYRRGGQAGGQGGGQGAGYRNRPSFQGRGGMGGGRGAAGGQRPGGGPGGGQQGGAGAGALYDDDGGLYSNPKG